MYIPFHKYFFPFNSKIETFFFKGDFNRKDFLCLFVVNCLEYLIN